MLGLTNHQRNENKTKMAKLEKAHILHISKDVGTTHTQTLLVEVLFGITIQSHCKTI